MLKDRGTIKWTSLMLPEHVQMLKNMWQEEETISQPIVDEQLLDELNNHLQIALSQNKKVRLTVYVNGQKQILIGKIKRVCETMRTITIILNNGVDRTLQVTSIMHIEQAEDY